MKMSFKKTYSFYLQRKVFDNLRDFIRKKFGTHYGYMSRVVEEAIIYYLQNPPKSLEEEYEELKNQMENLKKENENLKQEIQKLMNNPNFKIFEEYHKAKREIEELEREVEILKQKEKETENHFEPRFIKKDQDQNKKLDTVPNNNLPSFLKDNPWIDILKKRKKEESIYR
jgi:predicted RNase H-like nuclease (RuvC/YqgF family)